MKVRSSMLFPLLVCCISLFGQDGQLVPFEWGNKGKLMVPPGYKVKVWNYKEGTVTYLRYADSSEIFLHHGFMMRVPILQGGRYREERSTDSGGLHTRSGKMKQGLQCWREDQYKVYLNVGYQGVPATKVAQFDKALDSITLNQ
jgi:hypothetical protein